MKKLHLKLTQKQFDTLREMMAYSVMGNVEKDLTRPWPKCAMGELNEKR